MVPAWAISFLFAFSAGGFSSCSTVSQETPIQQPQAVITSPGAFTLAPEHEDFWDEGFEEDGLAISESRVNDPLEGVNRALFRFNDGLYRYVVGPVARGYAALVNPPLRAGIDRFFTHWNFPGRLVNASLQGKFQRARIETQRFAINTTLGFLGIFDPASQCYGWEPTPAEDFSQTFAYWGVGSGPYLVLPLFGPSTLRDLAGRFGDALLNPIQYIPELLVRIGLSTEKFVNASPELLNIYQGIKASAVEPYSALRSGYIQKHQKQVAE